MTGRPYVVECSGVRRSPTTAGVTAVRPRLATQESCQCHLIFTAATIGPVIDVDDCEEY